MISLGQKNKAKLYRILLSTKEFHFNKHVLFDYYEKNNIKEDTDQAMY